MIRALLWDNDGVLVDTESLYFQASFELLASIDVELTRDAYIDLSLRQGRSCFDLAADRGVDPDHIERLRIARNERYSELLRAGVDVRPGIRDCLEALSGTLPMAIVTSSRADHFALIHDGLGLLEHFDFVLTGDDYRRHKPHPEPYLAAAARLGIEPGECLAIEDTERGLRSARSAGMECVIYPHDLTRAGDFSDAAYVVGPDHTIEAGNPALSSIIEALVAGRVQQGGRR